MSYLDSPRIHFSGRYKASPSTINNTPNNYNPVIYPSPNELKDVELYWNPRGDGGFALVDCKVTQIDYADGTSATTPEEDPLIGQPVASIKSAKFPLEGALVDLDPMQQNVSEIWAMSLQIGGDAASVKGKFHEISFTGIWAQAQGGNAPRSSASGSAVYQSSISDLQFSGDVKASKFLDYIAQNSQSRISINFNVNTHNNSPPIWAFTDETFAQMNEAGVPESVLTKIAPMKAFIQNVGQPQGEIPAQDFVLFMLKQYLSVEEFNANIDVIMKTTSQESSYKPSTSEPFLYGLVTGSVGPTTEAAPTYFVPSRVMAPLPSRVDGVSTGPSAYFAPFLVSSDGSSVELNLGNSLPTNLPGTSPWTGWGTLSLVAFPNGKIQLDDAQVLGALPTTDQSFLTQRAGFCRIKVSEDVRAVPLGILCETPTARRLLLAEDADGYSLRADQFVYRMNPSVPTSADFNRGSTNTVHIHALKFGQPVPDDTEIVVKLMDEAAAEAYTLQTLGTGGTLGIKNLSIPQDCIQFNGQTITATSKTKNGIATFDLSCTAPGNPREYVNGQVYFVTYAFADASIQDGISQDPNDILSILVYDEVAEADAVDILGKFGRLYKIMDFLTDEEKIQQIDLRNMIKVLLEKPFTELEHMPVTRDLGEAARKRIVDWINELNRS